MPRRAAPRRRHDTGRKRTPRALVVAAYVFVKVGNAELAGVQLGELVLQGLQRHGLWQVDISTGQGQRQKEAQQRPWVSTRIRARC